MGVPCALPFNGGDAEIKGIELETTLRPVDGLLIDGAVSYLDFDYTSLVPNTGDRPVVRLAEHPEVEVEHRRAVRDRSRLVGLADAAGRCRLPERHLHQRGQPADQPDRGLHPRQRAPDLGERGRGPGDLGRGDQPVRQVLPADGVRPDHRGRRRRHGPAGPAARVGGLGQEAVLIPAGSNNEGRPRGAALFVCAGRPGHVARLHRPAARARGTRSSNCNDRYNVIAWSRSSALKNNDPGDSGAWRGPMTDSRLLGALARAPSLVRLPHGPGRCRPRGRAGRTAARIGERRATRPPARSSSPRSSGSRTCRIRRWRSRRSPPR